MPDFDPTVAAVVRDLHARFPTTPFLTLGQTVLWDEPLKATFCRMLEEIAPESTMVAAVHDTDYFAKLAHLEDRERKFALLPHNDGDTRDLWSAAGEMSSLFGSETVPTRQLLTDNGVAFDLVARGYPGGVSELLNRESVAWGWRALVHTEPGPLITADVRLRDIAPALREQLRWSFDETLKIVQSGADEAAVEVPASGCQCARPCNRQEAAARIMGWVDEYVELHPDDSLSDLYQWLTPRLWAMLRGGCICRLRTDNSLNLFRFNRATASLPRFRFLDLFLRPATRDVARRCYDEAIGGSGSGIYTLDHFGGPGALPFDVVIPGRGRGTLRLHQGSLFIETEEPITLCLDCNCSSIDDLADVLEAQLGDKVAVVGKAVALISMLANEFIFVFHEKASSYTALTQKMNASLRAAGIDLPLHPMLRLKYATWDAVGAATADLELPRHLAQAFGAPRLSAAAFASRWEAVCAAQDELRRSLKECRSPRELLAFFAANDDSEWTEKLAAYAAARDEMKTLRERTRALEEEVTALRARATEARGQAEAIERSKGADFRATVQPLRQRLFDIKQGAAQRLNPLDDDGKPRRLTREERTAEADLAAREAAEIEQLQAEIAQREAERAHFDTEIDALRQEAREAQAAAKSRVAERVAVEHSPETASARATTAGLGYEAELERLRRVRDAIWVSNGLRYTNYRPTAWWLPLVSPDGKWFDRLVETMTARVEEL